MIKDLKPDYIASTFDLAAPTFRHEEFAEYKAHREKAPDELHAQVPLIKEVLMAFGIPIYEKPGFEADDLIGTLAERSKKNPPAGGLQTIIMTGDLDTLQLVEGKKVVVFTLKKGVTDTVIYDEDEVFKRYGLKPEQLNDFRGLKGDPSDNIPGVPGVGEKTAAALIQNFGSLENLYEKISNFKFQISKKDKEKIQPPLSEKLIQKLLENKDMAFFSKKLSTIIIDVELDFELDKADWFKNLNRPEIEKLFRELGLYSLIKRLDEISILSQSEMALPEMAVLKEAEVQAQEVKNEEEIKEILGGINKNKEIVFDMNSGFINILLATSDGRGISDVANISWSLVVESKELLQGFKKVFESENILKTGHDLKELAKFLLGYGIELGGLGFDTKLAAYLLNSDRKDYSLDRIYFDEFQENKSEDVKKNPLFILKLKEKQSERLKKEKLDWLFENIEVPAARVLAEMELRGVLIDVKAIAKLSKLIIGEISGLEKKIYEFASMEFNINSPKQLKEVLFEKLGLKGKVRKTAKGTLSTAAGELEKLADEHPIVEQVLRYREVQKLKTTYIDPFPVLISKTTGRLHTTFNQTGTTTGRLASQDPNLQNIPVKTELGQEFRKAFIASSGFKLVSFDYSQIELRIAAHISKDEKMIASFRRGEDIHTRTAAEIFGVKPEAVGKNMRRDAKVLNFGILYGMGILGFQRASGVSRERARDFIDRYMKEFSGVAKYMEDMKIKARKDGYVTTIFGRRRWLLEIKSSMPQVVSQAERMAINMPIQGTAADLMKLAMIKVFEHIHNSGGQDDVFLLLQVHDELIFEIKDELIKKTTEKVKSIMENAYRFDVPLVVDVKVGNNWAEMERVATSD
jgi:DNA polymerase-1